MPRKVPPSQTVLLCLLFVGLLFLLDLYTPLGIADGVLYAFVVILSFWLPSSRATVLVAGSCTGLIMLGVFFLLQERSLTASPIEHSLLARCG